MKNNIATIQETAERCLEEGIPVGEFALRRLIKENKIEVAYIGKKALVSWNSVLKYFNLINDSTDGRAYE